jgi:ribose transport system ATP-binding protein
VVQRREARRIAAEALAEIAGPDSPTLRPEAIVRSLSPGDQQLVEIARALARTRARATGSATGSGCRLLILDEPTSSLAENDVARLFTRIRALRERGVSVLYISHFREELTAIADGYTVIRDGRTVATGRMAGASLTAIVHDMAGRSVEQLFPRSPRTRGDVVIAVDAVEGSKKVSGARTVAGASFRLHRGEVLGIAGLVGAGRTELLRAIFGLDPVVRGDVRVGVHSGMHSRAHASPAARLAEGVGMLSEDRKGEGRCAISREGTSRRSPWRGSSIMASTCSSSTSPRAGSTSAARRRSTRSSIASRPAARRCSSCRATCPSSSACATASP